MPGNPEPARRPDVTRSKGVRRPPKKPDPSAAREGQRGERTARLAAPGQGRPEDPQVPRDREVIPEDRTPETDTGRGSTPEEEGRTSR